MLPSKKPAARPRAAPAAPRASPRPTSSGLVRVYADVDESTAIALGVLAAQRRLTKRALLSLLITEAAQRR